LSPQVEAVALNFHGGGEPTTNFGVMQAAWDHFRQQAITRGLKARVSTISNGTFGKAVLEALIQPEWNVLISYDGPRQSPQRPTATGSDSRERVVANIRALVAAGKKVHTRATVTRDGLYALPELVTEAAELGVHGVKIEPSSTVGRGANLLDGPPDPKEFAEAYLQVFELGLTLGVRVTTTAWTSLRPGDGTYCGAQSGMTQVTPDGFISCCTEVIDGSDAKDPFIIGRLDTAGPRLEIWPVQKAAMQSRIGYDLPHCSSCAFVDTCAGGCASRARAQTGDLRDRDQDHCVASRIVNPAQISAIAEGRITPDLGWQPFAISLTEEQTGHPGLWGRTVALVPPMARKRWNAVPSRRPFVQLPRDPDPFFSLPSALINRHHSSTTQPAPQ
jgi:hypothetical protein